MSFITKQWQNNAAIQFYDIIINNINTKNNIIDVKQQMYRLTAERVAVVGVLLTITRIYGLYVINNHIQKKWMRAV